MVFCHNACSLECQVNYPVYKFLSVVIVYIQQSNLWSAEHSSQYMWCTTKHETNRLINWNSLSSILICKIYGCVVLHKLISGTLWAYFGCFIGLFQVLYRLISGTLWAYIRYFRGLYKVLYNIISGTLKYNARYTWVNGENFIYVDLIYQVKEISVQQTVAIVLSYWNYWTNIHQIWYLGVLQWVTAGIISFNEHWILQTWRS